MEKNAINTAATETATPATATTSTTATDTNNATTPAITEQAAATASLPADYLTGGYYKGEGKNSFTDPALMEYAEAIAQALAASKTPPSVVNKMLRTLKGVAGPRYPFAAKQAALKKVKIQAIDIECKKKTALLREVVERNLEAVQNEADYKACLSHLKDIAIYLAAAKN